MGLSPYLLCLPWLLGSSLPHLSSELHPCRWSCRRSLCQFIFLFPCVAMPHFVLPSPDLINVTLNLRNRTTYLLVSSPDMLFSSSLSCPAFEKAFAFGCAQTPEDWKFINPPCFRKMHEEWISLLTKSRGSADSRLCAVPLGF